MEIQNSDTTSIYSSHHLHHIPRKSHPMLPRLVHTYVLSNYNDASMYLQPHEKTHVFHHF
jgi:hypothetical protein